MNVLLIGLGGVGQRHLRILKEINPFINIYAVRSKNRKGEISDQMQLDESIDIIDKYNITSCKTIEDAAKFKMDFAVVSNPTSLHVQTTLILLKYKIPVLIEKPLSNSDKGIKEIRDLSIKNHTIISVAFMMRYHPCLVKLRGYIDSQSIGKIYNISINVNSFFPAWHNYEKYNSFYAGRKDLGGGVILTEIHEVDLLSELFGKPQYVFAIGGKMSNLDIDVEDNASILMKFDKGPNYFSATVNMSFVQRTPLRTLQVFGEEGNILWDISSQTISINNYVNDLSENYSFKDFNRNDMFKEQLINFINIIHEDGDAKISNALESALNAHEIAMAIKKSMNNGALVAL
tara:strand:+ start:3589 stop:4626 length:1038 start_codon:yes stop_codon:yes gene_type:complete